MSNFGSFNRGGGGYAYGYGGAYGGVPGGGQFGAGVGGGYGGAFAAYGSGPGSYGATQGYGAASGVAPYGNYGAAVYGAFATGNAGSTGYSSGGSSGYAGSAGAGYRSNNSGGGGGAAGGGGGGGGGAVSLDRQQRSVFVGNIPYKATENELIQIFSQAGSVVAFRLVNDRDTGRPKGFGFCEYSDPAGATSALEMLNGTELHGRPLRVGSSK